MKSLRDSNNTIDASYAPFMDWHWFNTASRQQMDNWTEAARWLASPESEAQGILHLANDAAAPKSAADLIPPPISAANQQSWRHQTGRLPAWLGLVNVYSINPIANIASWPAWHSSPFAQPPDIPHSIQAAGISWCVLGTGSAGLARPGQAFGVCQLRAALRPLIMIMEATRDSRLAACEWPPIAFVYDRMLGSSVDFLINARILRSVPAASLLFSSFFFLFLFCSACN